MEFSQIGYHAISTILYYWANFDDDRTDFFLSAREKNNFLFPFPLVFTSFLGVASCASFIIGFYLITFFFLQKIRNRSFHRILRGWSHNTIYQLLKNYVK